MFFDLQPRLAVLSDSNPELIHCFRTVAERPEELIKELKKFKISEQDFYSLRAIRPETMDDVSRAARFIYLNKTCYNGLYRVNKAGVFNAPYGHSENGSLCRPSILRAASRALDGVRLECGDYGSVLDQAGKGDFIYLDPPYLPIGKFSDFKRYTKDFFYEGDHASLAQRIKMLAARGCFILLSNSFHETIADMYRDFFQLTVHAPRFVNCKGEGRGKVKELLIANYPIPVCR